MSTKSVANIKAIFERFLPERACRLHCLSLYAESIRHANRHAPNEWAVIVPSGKQRIRLNVGHLIVFAVKQGKLALALDLETLKAHPEIEKRLCEAPSWEWETGKYPYFKLVPSRNGHYFPQKDPSEEVQRIVQELNFAFIKRIGLLKRKLHSQSRNAHIPAILEVLRQELQESIPDPGGVTPTDILPEEVADGEILYEGAVQQISVISYERNPAARRECLEHYGYQCAVCKKEMAEIYGDAAEGLIHVHHLKPLSEVRETYEIDPIRDLRPVCPNCHAVIHRRKPPYTIEEVQGFLEKQK